MIEASAAPPHLFRTAARALVAAALVFGMIGMAEARQFGSGGNAAAMAGPPADSDVAHPLPQLQTHAPIGFRLYRPGYRVAGKGALVSVQLCRLPFWAGASPQHLRVERLGRDGQPGENHEQSLARLGLRLGNNCTSGAVRLDTLPSYGETIKICALSGPGNCP